MGMQVDDEVYEEFASEARERLGTIESTLVDMETSTNQGEDIKSIFRDIHTIKGNSQFIGIQNIKELSHAFEDMFGTLRNGTIQLSRGLIDVSLEAVDLLGRMLDDKTATLVCPPEVVQEMKDIEAGKIVVDDQPAPVEAPIAAVVEGAPEGDMPGAVQIFQINPFNVIYLKLHKSLDHAAGEALSSFVFDHCNEEKTFIFDASYIVSVDEETDTILGRMTQEIDIFNSHVVFINATHSFIESVCDGNENMSANTVGEAITKLCRMAA